MDRAEMNTQRASHYDKHLQSCPKMYGFEMIHTEEIAEILSKEQAWLIDLRDEESYRNGHMKFSRNLPFEHIERWRWEIPDAVSLVLYCEHGNQSLLAARKLKERRGTVYTVIGGYQAFKAQERKGIDTAVFKR